MIWRSKMERYKIWQGWAYPYLFLIELNITIVDAP